MKAEAATRAKALRDQADVEAERIRPVAQSKDPRFYSFLKQLEAYQRIFDNKSTLLLSTHSEMFDTFFHPPKVGEEKNHESKKQTNMGTNK